MAFTIPNSFIPNSPALPAKVNENFLAIAAELNAFPTDGALAAASIGTEAIIDGAVTLAKLHEDSVETALDELSDTDEAVPTSAAVQDYVAEQVAANAIQEASWTTVPVDDTYRPKYYDSNLSQWIQATGAGLPTFGTPAAFASKKGRLDFSAITGAKKSLVFLAATLAGTTANHETYQTLFFSNLEARSTYANITWGCRGMNIINLRGRHSIESTPGQPVGMVAFMTDAAGKVNFEFDSTAVANKPDVWVMAYFPIL